jgi:hypothetical protein
MLTDLEMERRAARILSEGSIMDLNGLPTAQFLNIPCPQEGMSSILTEILNK